MTEFTQTHEAILAATQRWLTRAIIGLNLCPFAKSVHVKQQIRYVISDATDAEGVEAALELALLELNDSDPADVDTTLLILPAAFADFLDYNDFLHQADRLLKLMGFQGKYQIASFHPQYQFAGTEADDIENYTNRAPYPTLHLIREASIERAVAAFPDASVIYERNQETMRRIGLDGWRKLMSADEPD
ncbi:DUF1415 domain-containing protein [Silvimonas sp.]|uniref:DUF1415 domain-containing protein n=1 Tax=Silvimonas sp. TaxID=2650811 RepID=UPI0028471283|nr:DUF1415 domain-containing protein [Silvimonas sp.]MDR3426555.1 DUF1415 domain-containing protein [Silvimonas sp.]